MRGEVSSESAVAEPISDSGPLVQHAIDLSRGHRLLIEQTGEASALHLVGANGRLALTIRITEAGAVVHLDGNVALEASGALELSARRVAVRASEGIALETAGELALKAEGDVSVQGENVRLNC